MADTLVQKKAPIGATKDLCPSFCVDSRPGFGTSILGFCVKNHDINSIQRQKWPQSKSHIWRNEVGRAMSRRGTALLSVPGAQDHPHSCKSAPRMQGQIQHTGVYPYPLGAGVCETKSQKGRARHRKPFVCIGFTALRRVSDHGLGRGQTMG